jgi:hypothetical protein
MDANPVASGPELLFNHLLLSSMYDFASWPHGIGRTLAAPRVVFLFAMSFQKPAIELVFFAISHALASRGTWISRPKSF